MTTVFVFFALFWACMSVFYLIAGLTTPKSQLGALAEASPRRQFLIFLILAIAWPYPFWKSIKGFK